MRKLIALVGLVFTLRESEAQGIKKFNQDMITNIQKDTELDEEKFRGRAPASSSPLEEIEEFAPEKKVDTNEQTIQRRNFIGQDRW